MRRPSVGAQPRTGVSGRNGIAANRSAVGSRGVNPGVRSGVTGRNRPGIAARPGGTLRQGTAARPGTTVRPRTGVRPDISGRQGIAARPGTTPRSGTIQPRGSTRSGAIAGGRTPTGVQPDRGQLGNFLGLRQPLDRRGALADRSGRPRLQGTPISPDRSLSGRRGGVVVPDRPGFGFDRRPGRTGIAGRDQLGRQGVINRDRFGRLGPRGNPLFTRPGWARLDRDRLGVVRDRWQDALVRHGGVRDFGHRDRWHRWGTGIRNGWWPHWRDRAHFWFTRDWWHHHRPFLHSGFWHPWHWNRFHDFGWGFWWGVPTWPVLSNWFAWPAATYWSAPVYYDYGAGGNVVYDNDYVYVNDVPVATPEEFAESAAALATVPPPPSEEVVQETDWMPLGTFALSTREGEAEPHWVVQLAVNKEGIISGTLYNTRTDEVRILQGRVDKETQRVAFRVENNEEIVMETGLYNLTQNDAPVLVHFGPDDYEQYLLVRLEAPEEQGKDQLPD